MVCGLFSRTEWSMKISTFRGTDGGKPIAALLFVPGIRFVIFPSAKTCAGTRRYASRERNSNKFCSSPDEFPSHSILPQSTIVFLFSWWF
ncbi:hypothetical protein CEXT_149881 [Caerostris extrusa]|uniref:Ycf15 n=1 Tax=Caerostris extrusa TaxID=172846 RepID=A0AAV4SBK1_CAEEX|nr:hypothetical protein CEXT_149881 [Caerostris extrusa]